MNQYVQGYAEIVAGTLEIAGVTIIALLVLYSLLWGMRGLWRKEPGGEIFRQMRVRIVRSILLGLEILVAADIIHTVAVDLSYSSIGVLGIIVLIRTFLSFVLELELTGRWPWQKAEA